ncbi:hypothetical protein [Streptomyces arboris]|uniref:Tat pathway signal protein n=1 Tax=Streptomyces arboris TaxID=2600619 RepID=A0A5N5EK93_9ACTN|nr:hypothetical protein [Streptomyces arboris]KAB2591348.1 hypothetical protein F5983_16205 [Streptomyces arboris]
MPRHLCTTARSAAYTALLLALTVLLSLLAPMGTAQAKTRATTAATADTENCPSFPLSAFGEAAPEGNTLTLPAEGTACYTFTVEKPGMHRLVQSGGNEVRITVHDGEEQVECYDPYWGDGWCRLERTGEFTLRLANRWDPSTVTFALTPLATDEGCTAQVPTDWASPPFVARAAGPTAVQCARLDAKPGERYTDDVTTTRYGDGTSWITDETGARICPPFNEDDSDGCVLPGDGPYRVLTNVSASEGGFPAEYALKVRRTSDPVGCARVPLNTYNSAPTTVTPVTGCKTFTAPHAGPYEVYGVDSSRTKLTVYDRAGKTVCAPWNGCELPAAGDYTVRTDDATLILDRSSTAGCESAGLGLHRSTFASAGEIDCVQLPLPAGARLAALTPLSGPEPRPDLTLFDARGAYVCGSGGLSDGTCALTGTAPFRLQVSTDDADPATGPYAIALHRTDAASGCQALPAGDFTEQSASARITTGGGVFSQCLSIPADAHSAAEILQLKAAPGTMSTAQFSVLDKSGKQVCFVYSSLHTWTACDLAPGVAHTVLVTGRDTTATYSLTRRDVTATAKGCTPNPATKVGGPSSGGPTGTPGEVRCRQVTTADTKDTLHINVRDALGTANIVSFGADGTALCQSNQACAVTGSTRYQVLVTVPSRLKAAPDHRFDAVRIATATGPAEGCVRVPNVSYGYGPVTGTLDEARSTFCAVLPTAYRDRFDMEISDTTGAEETAVPSLYDASLGNGCIRFIPSGYECYVDEPYTKEVTPSTLILSLPETAPKTSYKAKAVCSVFRCGTEQFSIGTVSPETGATGGKVTVKVTGTALHEEDVVRLYANGRQIEAKTTAVSADRRTLTAVLDLTGVPTGTWSLSVITHNGVQYLRNPFTVTAARLTSTKPPVISGAAKVGAKLTAGTGSWSVAPSSYAYQWKADGTAIAGVTAATYTVPAKLLGKKITVTVTARRSGHPDGQSTSAAVTVAKGDAPKATAKPVISGKVKVGAKLTAGKGTWAPKPSSYTYRWKADGKAIAGATGATYTVPAKLLGKKVTVTVTAVLTGHTSGSATSAAVKVAKGDAPKATAKPVISGKVKVGAKLTAGKGKWTPAPTSYSYQWYANGKAIAKATGSKLTLKAAQRGKKITVKVTAHRTGHTSGASTSTATKAVAR